MKNKTLIMSQRNQTKILEWLCEKEPEDDFLIGKTPSEFQDIWEDEE